MSPIDQAIVRAILTAAKVPRRDHDWMVESCPSVERARELYSRSYRQPQVTPPQPAELYSGVHKAGERLRYARREGDEDTMSRAFAQLQTEIAIVYWRLEESAGRPPPELSDETKRNVDVLDKAGAR